ncbi:tetratricopeptide repeat protein [Salegentibacter salegens]|uniref:Tetratricopeptide repeat-containing protein n=1 Tax=Salegentibacter salegens TaxID=143223 RepID=A0A1M7N6W6_9FLAO|nr:tetratricopeptide repeat protein [Salegentibacter salegens]PRX45658.1 tetratricopeptide repeat protein [Salegentibacter salegens]SHM99214.1 Tetratricopeptide repeat-containing protein [Salegentibacter salegens]
MKARFIALITGAVLGSSVLSAQSNDCATMAALAYDDAKAKDYDAAYEPLMKVREECPKYSLATFQYGERALNYKIENAEGAEKEQFIKELIGLWEERLELFPNKTSKGKIYSDIAQLRYDHKLGTKEELYNAFDKVYTEDRENFTSPKGLYAYFDLMVEMQDAGDRELQDVFDSYDKVLAKIEEEENDAAERLAPLLKKQEEGEDLTTKEQKQIEYAEINLKNYNLVKGSINAKLGARADCDNLIPLYKKDFEEKKSDVNWLQNANARLSAKDCTEDPLFFQVSEALHQLEPSANSAYSLGQLAEADGDRAKALEYYNEAAELEEDPNDQARIYYRIASNYKERGSFSQARNYYRKALDAKPSLGNAYLQISNMIAQSANNCGETSFDKRAVYWLAADYAARAARVDPSIASNANQTATAYRGRAPQKSDVFQQGRSTGEAIQVGCWIGETVRIPQM